MTISVKSFQMTRLNHALVYMITFLFRALALLSILILLTVPFTYHIQNAEFFTQQKSIAQHTGFMLPPTNIQADNLDMPQIDELAAEQTAMNAYIPETIGIPVAEYTHFRSVQLFIAQKMIGSSQ